MADQKYDPSTLNPITAWTHLLTTGSEIRDVAKPATSTKAPSNTGPSTQSDGKALIDERISNKHSAPF